MFIGTDNKNAVLKVAAGILFSFSMLEEISRQ